MVVNNVVVALWSPYPYSRPPLKMVLFHFSHTVRQPQEFLIIKLQELLRKVLLVHHVIEYD